MIVRVAGNVLSDHLDAAPMSPVHVGAVAHRLTARPLAVALKVVLAVALAVDFVGRIKHRPSYPAGVLKPFRDACID